MVCDPNKQTEEEKLICFVDNQISRLIEKLWKRRMNIYNTEHITGFMDVKFLDKQHPAYRKFYKFVAKNNLYKPSGKFSDLSVTGRRKTQEKFKPDRDLPDLNPYTPSGRFFTKNSPRFLFEANLIELWQKNRRTPMKAVKSIEAEIKTLEALKRSIWNRYDRKNRVEYLAAKTANQRSKVANHRSTRQFFNFQAAISSFQK